MTDGRTDTTAILSLPAGGLKGLVIDQCHPKYKDKMLRQEFLSGPTKELTYRLTDNCQHQISNLKLQP